MKVRLKCTYYRQPDEKIGEPGDELEMSADEAAPLLRGGSAEIVEPPKKSERE